MDIICVPSNSQISWSALACEVIYLLGQNIDDFKCKKLKPGGFALVVTNATEVFFCCW